MLTNQDFDNGIQNYNKAIQLDPHHTEAYYNRGIAYAAKGAVDKAIIDYDAAIKLNSQHAEAYNNRGIAYGRKNKPDNAYTRLQYGDTNQSMPYRSLLQSRHGLRQQKRF